MNKPICPVAVVVLNYNGADIVLRCARSFAAQTVLPARVLFIDNGSRDYEPQKVKKEFGPRYDAILEFTSLPENLGYAKGMNLGIQKILNQPGLAEWVITLNNDTELNSDFFEKLNGHFLKSNSKAALGMLGPKIKEMNARDTLDATGISLCLDGMSTARGQREKDLAQYDQKTHILIPNGVAAVYRLSMLNDIGLLDETFWAYCEDSDLGLRAWIAGWECEFVPECILFHARSYSHGKYSLKKLYLVERNHYWLVIKTMPLPFLVLTPLFSIYRYLLQVLAVVLKKGQGAHYGGSHSPVALAFVTSLGILHAVVGSPRAFYQRLRWIRKRRRSLIEAMTMIWKNRLRFSDLLLK